MSERCFSLCPDDPQVRCEHPQGHGRLVTVEDGEHIESAHAAPARGCYWDSGVSSEESVTLELTGDQLDALLTLLELHDSGASLLELIEKQR